MRFCRQCGVEHCNDPGQDCHDPDPAKHLCSGGMLPRSFPAPGHESFVCCPTDAMYQGVPGAANKCPPTTPMCYDGVCIRATCEHLAEYCDRTNIVGIRARQLCPETCGCDDPTAPLIFSLAESGCPSVCSHQLDYKVGGTAQHATLTPRLCVISLAVALAVG